MIERHCYRTSPYCSLLFGVLLICCHACARQADSPHASEESAPIVDTSAGGSAYVAACAPCHGFDAEGLPGIGIPLRSNPTIQDMTAGELVEFLKTGRAQDDPLNTTGIEMPPRGGAANLSEADLRNIVAYLQAISATP